MVTNFTSENRYLSIDRFTRFCNKMNVNLSPFNKELELYEESRIIFPAARILIPDEYAITRHKFDKKNCTYGKSIPGWEELENLINGRNNSSGNEKFWHHLDLAFKFNIKYLFDPALQEFKPWNSYFVEINNKQGEPIKRSTVKNYYHRWQIHKIYKLRKMYPLFAKHKWFLDNIKEEKKENIKNRIPNKNDGIADLFGYEIYFESLSFYIELFQNQRHFSFSFIPEKDGITQLNDTQYEHYKIQQIKHAKFALKKYGLNNKGLINFLVFALILHSEYQEDEKFKLATNLENDIYFLVSFISGVTGFSSNDIENEIGKHQSFWIQKKFRHLDKAQEIYDFSLETLNRMIGGYNNLTPQYKLKNNDLEELISFISKNSLFIIPNAIFDIDKSFNEIRDFHKTMLFNGLSNLAIGLECFLKEIANIANSNSSKYIDTKDLFHIINTMFAWGCKFKDEKRNNLRQYSCKNNPFSYIEEIFNDPDIINEIKIFIIAHCTRNLLSHNYTLDQKLYGHLFKTIYTSIIHTILYSWSYANKNFLYKG